MDSIMHMHTNLTKTTGVLALVFLTLAPDTASAQSYTNELLAVPYTPPHIESIGATNNRLLKMGYLDVTLYNGWNGNPVDKTGSQDSTAALRKAIDDAFDYQLAAYFPSGTYKVSDTLYDAKKTIGSRGHSCNITGSAVNRPVIKLASGAAGFGSASTPKPIVYFFAVGDNSTPFGTPSADIAAGGLINDGGSVNFLSSLQNFVIDCNGNPGAIGVRFHGAQQSGVHNVKVIATGAYAGFYSVPSRSSGGGSGIEVVGGQYGIILDEDAGCVLVDLTLSGQTTAAIKNTSFVPVSLVGFHITKSSGPGLQIFAGYNSAGGSMTLYDGIFELGSGAYAIDNGIGKNLYARNVYVTGSDNLVTDPGQNVTGSGTWKRIAEFGYTDTRDYEPLQEGDNNVDAFSILNGVIGKATIKTIENSASAPPSDLISRHSTGQLPSWEDPGALVLTEETSAVGDASIDNYSIIQDFLDAHPSSTIIIPRGRFAVSQTLTLPANVKVVGIDRNLSRIIAHSSFLPTSETPIIQTVDDPDATTWLGPITIGYPIGNGDNDWFAELKWRAGRNSVVFVANSRYGMTGGFEGQTTNPHARCIITGNGGGRWYFWGMDRVDATTLPDYRHLRISGTSEPLWIYGCNLEKGQCDTRSEVTNCANVRIFSIKVEVGRDVMWVTNSTNIGVFDAGAMRKAPNLGEGLFEIRGSSNNVVLGNINPQLCGELGDYYTVRENDSFGEYKVQYSYLVSMFKRGELDDSVMHIGANLPAAPSNLTATAVSSSEIDVNWMDNDGDETGFDIDRALDDAFTSDLNTDSVGAIGGTGGFGFYQASGLNPDTTYFFRVRAINADGESSNSNIASATTLTLDTTPPAFSSLTANPDHLWPVNHLMIAVTLDAVVNDDRDPTPATRIISVTSSEPPDAHGSGNTGPDWEITGDLTLNLRAERSGTGTGRIYTVIVQSTDEAGNSSTASVLVPVAHNNDTQPPVVTLTAPNADSLVGGSGVAVTATASDNDEVVGVKFLLDGASIAVEDGSAPYGISWNTTSTSDGSHVLTAVARDAAGNTAVSAGVPVTVDNTPPDVTLTAPANGALLSGSGVSVTADATDANGVAGMQFLLDGSALGAELTAAPYAITWDTTAAGDGDHTLTAVARDTVGNTATAVSVAVVVDNLPPSVAITDPVAGSTVGGINVGISADASDIVGVAGVQFQVDGLDVGAEDTTAPYTIDWDSTTVGNGSHTLTAIARDAVGHATTSAAVPVTVDNSVQTEVQYTIQSATAGSNASSIGNAYDNNTGTRWQSPYNDNPENWAEFDLGSSKPITKIRILQDYADLTNTNILVDGSIVWNGTITKSQWTEIALTGVSGQKVRIDRDHIDRLRLIEVEIYGTGSP